LQTLVRGINHDNSSTVYVFFILVFFDGLFFSRFIFVFLWRQATSPDSSRKGRVFGPHINHQAAPITAAAAAATAKAATATTATTTTV
jgi:hypothetical protein